MEKEVWDALKDGLTELATPKGRALSLFPGSLKERRSTARVRRRSRAAWRRRNRASHSTGDKAAKSATSTIPIVFRWGQIHSS